MITTKRLTLREPLPTDLLDVFVIHADPVNNQFNPAGPDASLEDSQKRLSQWIEDWEETGIGYFVVENKGLVVGFAGVREANTSDWGEAAEDVLNIYYLFAPEVQGHGFAGEAIRAVIEYAKEQRPSRAISLVTIPENSGAIGFAKHMGFEFFRYLETNVVNAEYRYTEHHH